MPPKRIINVIVVFLVFRSILQSKTFWPVFQQSVSKYIYVTYDFYFR